MKNVMIMRLLSAVVPYRTYGSIKNKKILLIIKNTILCKSRKNRWTWLSLSYFKFVQLYYNCTLPVLYVTVPVIYSRVIRICTYSRTVRTMETHIVFFWLP